MTYWNYEYYGEIRGNNPSPQLVRIFTLLEELGYIRSYTIFSEDKNPKWIIYGKSDDSIDCAVVDSSFKENNALAEKINSMLWDSVERRIVG